MEASLAAGPGRRPIQVGIVDDHPAIVELFQERLEQAPGIAVIGVADDGPAALRLVAARPPDVLLLDLELPGCSGREVARRVRATNPAVAILVLTACPNLDDYQRLTGLGVAGYLGKHLRPADVVAAVRVVASGQRLVTAPARPAPGGPEQPLTPRELEILRLVALGRRNAEVAAELGIACSTVEFHLKHVLGKLGVHSRTTAVRRGHELGLIDVRAADDREA